MKKYWITFAIRAVAAIAVGILIGWLSAKGLNQYIKPTCEIAELAGIYPDECK